MPARFLHLLFAAAMLLVPAAPASAQGGFLQRLFSGRLGSVADGSYVAGDRVRFEIEHAGKRYLLHFEGDPEIFVLTADRTSLGARVLRYDSGETAIRVAGWGALTLYTDWQPNGLPAERVGDAPSLAPAPLSLQDVQFAAAQAAEHLRTAYRLKLPVVVDWSVLETSAELRATATNALENAARGIERLVLNRDARKLVARRVSLVTLATGRQPGLRLEGKTIVVTFNPEQGYSGCASSRAIARAIAALLQPRTTRVVRSAF